MLYLNKHRPESIITWDWKEQVNFSMLDAAVVHLRTFNIEPHFVEFETGGDEHAVMIAPKGFNTEVAHAIYKNLDSFYPDSSY